ncbi:DUF488 domain-containing protein [Naasia aerilata]|uniref:DUF488 domain-containing protein n=1 Tax=Naasia aerilata TaxID=1162966 RepID=A0ABN6XPP4_9MICO|nr:DUF488 family protein [Naasia aerilata]BDZ45812.1 hypothetical protein GCM10025866_17210 [Naasia aerilata]
MPHLTIKRVYQPPSAADGARVLVDRLWPRGVDKDEAELTVWMKEIAPSPELRRWWGHDPARLAEFTKRYRAELDANPATDELVELLTKHRAITLVYAAKDPRINHARVLAEYLAARERSGNGPHAD